MSGRWTGDMGGGDSSQDFTQATQDELALEPEEYTQVEPLMEGNVEEEENAKEAEPVPWGRLMRVAGGAAIPLMPRPEQPQGRAMNEVTLGRSKVCEVQVVDRRISSKHCRIYCELVSGHLGGMEVFVEDMSANGTWVNQTTKLTRGARRLLNSGDEIALLNPNKQHKKPASGEGQPGAAGGAESGKESGDGERLLDAEDAMYTFINLDRNRGSASGRGGSLTVAETLRSGTVPEGGSPALRSGANGFPVRFGGARKVEDFYDVREMIGHGTSGEVRRAINRATGKQVAVKVIETRKFALTPGLTPKELVQEAEMLKRVDHEYIIKLEDIFQSDQAVYLVMDLVSGGDLFDRIVEKGLYPEDLAQELLFRVLTAVQYLHSEDIVHRDLKPENILLVGRDNDVDVKITDFGLAKRANKEGLKTFCGTPQYFAPEVLKRRNTVLGVGRYGKEADMWSVGVILYILLSGTHPFHTTTLFDQITHASYSMEGPEWEHISEHAKDLVRKLLTENPTDRLTAQEALAHPFITQRAGAGKAKPASTPLDRDMSTEENGNRANEHGAAGSHQADAAPTNQREDTQAGGKTDRGEGEVGGSEARTTEDEGLVARNSSQDTDVSSAGPDEVSLKSKSPSPAEGGGRSARAAPCPRDSPRESLPPRHTVSERPPPQPRPPRQSKGPPGNGNSDRPPQEADVVGSTRKKLKKGGAGDKPSYPYSQLQMHSVGAGGSSVTGDAGSSQEGVNAARHRRSRVVGVVDAGSGPAANGSANGRGASATVKSQARARGEPPRDGCSGASTEGSVTTKDAAEKVSLKGRGKRGAPSASQGVASSRVGQSPPSRRADAFDAAADLAGDEIMDYSSDESVTKQKRTRATRAQGAKTTASSNGAHRDRVVDGAQRTAPSAGDGGTLKPSGFGRSALEGHTNGDRVAQAAAGGAAATLEESVGGGAPAGSGISDATPRNGRVASERPVGGRGGKQQPKGGGKSQRTMTHLWKRAGEEG